MPAGLCVPTPGRGSALGCWSPLRVRDEERWWQWPEEGPVTDGARDRRKGGLRRGRSRGRRRREAPRPCGPEQELCLRRTLAEAAWAAPPSRLPDLPANRLQGWAGKGSQKGADCAGSGQKGQRRWHTGGEDPGGSGGTGRAGSRGRACGRGRAEAPGQSRELPSAPCCCRHLQTGWRQQQSQRSE